MFPPLLLRTFDRFGHDPRSRGEQPVLHSDIESKGLPGRQPAGHGVPVCLGSERARRCPQRHLRRRHHTAATSPSDHPIRQVCKSCPLLWRTAVSASARHATRVRPPILSTDWFFWLLRHVFSPLWRHGCPNMSVLHTSPSLPRARSIRNMKITKGARQVEGSGRALTGPNRTYSKLYPTCL